MSLEVLETVREVEFHVYRCEACGVVGTVWEFKGRDLCERCLSLAEEIRANRKRGNLGASRLGDLPV